FAKEQGEDKVTGVTAWRWMMSRSSAVKNILLEAGFDKDMATRILKAPKPKRVVMKSTVMGPPSFEEVVAMEKALQIVPQKVIGQDGAVNELLVGFQRAKLGYGNKNKPFQPKVRTIMLGPSGVGKTYTAKVLAKVLNRPL